VFCYILQKCSEKEYCLPFWVEILCLVIFIHKNLKKSLIFFSKKLGSFQPWLIIVLVMV